MYKNDCYMYYKTTPPTVCCLYIASNYTSLLVKLSGESRICYFVTAHFILLKLHLEIFLCKNTQSQLPQSRTTEETAASHPL